MILFITDTNLIMHRKIILLQCAITILYTTILNNFHNDYNYKKYLVDSIIKTVSKMIIIITGTI